MTAMQDLEAALAAIEHRAPRAPDITKARGYNPALGAIYSPADTVNYLADRLEAQGVKLVREPWGFRTRNAADRAADLEADLATFALGLAAE